MPQDCPTCGYHSAASTLSYHCPHCGALVAAVFPNQVESKPDRGRNPMNDGRMDYGRDNVSPDHNHNARA